VTVYISSPALGDPPHNTRRVNANMRIAEKRCAEAAKEGNVPIAPLLLWRGFMSPLVKEDRAKMGAMATEVMRICDEVWVYADSMTVETLEDISKASAFGIPVIKRGGSKAGIREVGN
jgi:hypothetical protein